MVIVCGNWTVQTPLPDHPLTRPRSLGLRSLAIPLICGGGLSRGLSLGLSFLSRGLIAEASRGVSFGLTENRDLLLGMPLVPGALSIVHFGN